MVYIIMFAIYAAEGSCVYQNTIQAYDGNLAPLSLQIYSVCLVGSIVWVSPLLAGLQVSAFASLTSVNRNKSLPFSAIVLISHKPTPATNTTHLFLVLANLQGTLHSTVLFHDSWFFHH